MAHPEHNEQSHHHIIPNRTIFMSGGALLVLTIITVAVAHVDLGRLNFFVAMAVATVKASVVALIFMNLWHDKKENGVIFASSFLFLAIFLVLSATDLFFRGDVYVKGPLMAEAKTTSKLKEPWISTPQLISRGKELYQQQCVACHGLDGKGDGPAAGALNPPPRNFHQTAGWKNGRKPTMVFKTLKEGIPGTAMAGYATVPSDDRWALAAYVVSLNPTTPEKDMPEDFKKAGIDPTGAAEAEEKIIPIEFAMERMAAPAGPVARGYSGALAPGADDPANVGARIYNAKCVACHGAQGEGGIKVHNLGVDPKAYVTTQPFSAQSLGSQDSFNRMVIKGLPGEMMPGNGELSGDELRDLFQYVKNLKAGR